MLISEHIEALQKLLKEEGDKELFMWVDEEDEFLYPVKMPIIKAENICCNEYQIKPEFRDDKNSENGGSILIVTNLYTSSFNRDEDDVQDLELEIIDVDNIDKVEENV